MNDEFFKNNAIGTDGMPVERTEMLFFSVGDTVYGAEISCIEEIISIEPITFVPRMPNYIKGVINLRGKIVPIINLHSRFGTEEIPYDDRTCIVIVFLPDGEQVGLIIDRIREVVRIDNDKINPAPNDAGVNQKKYIKSVIDTGDGEIKQVLDISRVADIRQNAAADEKNADEDEKPDGKPEGKSEN